LDKPGSQEELLHTLVSLVAQGRQILLAADRHPDKMRLETQNSPFRKTHEIISPLA